MATVFFKELVKMKGLPQKDIPAEYKGVLIMFDGTAAMHGTAAMCASYTYVSPTSCRLYGPIVHYTYDVESNGYIKPAPDGEMVADLTVDPEDHVFWACPKLLKCFMETQYVWNKVPPLKFIFHQLINGEVAADPPLLGAIQANDWKAVDAMMRGGKELFWLQLQQLFFIFYFLKGVTRKQYQYAFGIQQVCWMVNKENPLHIRCKQGAKIHYWEEIGDVEAITQAVNNQFRHRLIEPYDNPIVFAGNTVWYEFQCSEHWSGYGTHNTFYPVPESFNVSRFACSHVPHLVFGTLNADTLLKFVVKYNRRPLAAHLPDAPNNLTDFHVHKLPILSNWIHDLTHTASPFNAELSVLHHRNGASMPPHACLFTGIDYLNQACKLNLRADINPDEFIRQYEQENTALNKCLNFTTSIGDTTKKFTRAEVLNESGSMYLKPHPVVLGGRSRRRLRTRTKKRKNI